MKAYYIQSAWGDSVDNPTYEDVLAFIEQTKEYDEEHGAFWVGAEDEYVLEVEQDLTVTLTSPDDQEVRTQAKDWEQVKVYYQLFLAGRRDFIQ